MADVFVSYARKDKDRVAPLVQALLDQGWSVWWDPAITPGQEFDRQIAAELSSAAAVLVVWTPISVESRWVRGEARDGADRGILVPVRFANAVLPIDFRAFHTIDLADRDAVSRGPAFQETAQALRTLIDRKRATMPAPALGAVAAPVTPTAGTLRVALCVLPFANPGGDPEQQALIDGITGDIITELSRWRRFAVRSRSASFRFRGDAVDVGHVGRELNVRFVVTGSVRRVAERVRINVELIEADSGSQVWAERFDCTHSEVFAVQDQVVQRVASTLGDRVQESDAERARRKPPASLDAYECLLKGNALPWDEPGAAEEATRLFEKAIELDPGYGLAYALLATMRCGAWRDNPDSPDALLDEACALARRAVELDDGESTCHSLLGHIYLYRHSYELAEQHGRRAVDLNPNNAWNFADFGMVLCYLGRTEEALAWLLKAREIDPYFGPPWYWRQTGQAYMALRRYEDALSMFAHIPRRSSRIAAYMAACHARLGHADRAAALAAECVALQPAFTIRQRMTREPYRMTADSEQLADSMRLAGLPE